MSTINLHIDCTTPAWGNALAASLPASVIRVDGTAADVILVHGLPDWPARLSALIGEGHRRFILADPCIVPVAALDELTALAGRTASHVVISETHADNPAVAPLRDLLEGPYSAVTITGIGTDLLPDLALQQIRIARTAGLDDMAVVHSLATPDTLVATLDAQLKGAPVLLRLTIARSHAGLAHHRLMAQAPTETACIEIASTPGARPATAFRVTAHSATVLPMIYESAHRSALRAVVADPAPDGIRNDLCQWAQDVELALALSTVR